MRLTVEHATTYRYAQAVRSLVQTHRLTPTICQSQEQIDWQITVSDGVKGASFRDGAGDAIQGWSIAGPVDAVTVTVRGTVETSDTAGVLRGNRELVSPEVYLRPTALTESSAALAELAKSVAGSDILSLAHDLSAAVSGAIAYRSGVTQSQSSAADAMAMGEGVCQDHAHALIAVARLHGIAGRYVSGYLYTDATGAMHDAAHAWAELHVRGLGWVGFDPANECCPDARYIRLGSGFDARDAAPIRGVARGLAADAGAEALEVAVAVRAAGQ